MSKRKTSRSCGAGLGVGVLALAVDPPVAGRERPLDPRVVAGDHVVVARRAVAVVADDHVVRVAERLAAAVVVEAAVAVRVEDAGRGRAAAGDVVFAEVAVDRVGAAVALDVVVRAGVARSALSRSASSPVIVSTPP